ncbi:MAG: DUF3298 and DUF4163 domain-containing protein [Bacteroidales bacterium]|nr:DUF3298 and DUF4163 domain-containing protein [Bacteroidales bacterium]
MKINVSNIPAGSFWTAMTLITFVFSLQPLFIRGQYYKHFTGEIEGGLKLSMDIISEGKMVHGHYYYFFHDHDESGALRTGKIIPLSGTATDNGFSVSEFSEGISVFTIECAVNDTCSGTWKQKDEKKPLSVILTEDYSDGSIPLCLQQIKKQHPLHPGAGSPVALFEALLLWACEGSGALAGPVNHAVMDLLSADEETENPASAGDKIGNAFINSYILATEGIENMENASSFNWENKYNMAVVCNENGLLSLRFDKYVFTGGAHGLTMSNFVNISLTDGRPLTEDDIFIEDYSTVLEQLLNNKLRKMNGIQEGEWLSSSGFFVDTISNPGRFYINHSGIGFIYNVYEIAPYSTGVTELFFTFDELQAILKPGFPGLINRKD